MGPLKEHYDTNWVGHLWEKEDEGTIVLALLLAGHGEGYIGYIKSCFVCQQDKSDKRWEVGLLTPLPVLNRP